MPDNKHNFNESEFDNFEREYIYTDIKDVWVKKAKQSFTYSKESFAYGTFNLSDLKKVFEDTFFFKGLNSASSLAILGGGIGRLAFFIDTLNHFKTIDSFDLIDEYIQFADKLKSKSKSTSVHFHLKDAQKVDLACYQRVIVCHTLWDEAVIEEVFANILDSEESCLVVALEKPAPYLSLNFYLEYQKTIRTSWTDSLCLYFFKKAKNNSPQENLKSWSYDPTACLQDALAYLGDELNLSDDKQDKEKILNQLEMVSRLGADYWLESFQFEAARYALYLEEETNLKNRAIRWYKKAALAGSELSQLKLGLYFQEEKKSPKDQEQAIFWLSLAAEQGSQVARDYLAHLVCLNAYRIYDEHGKNFHASLKALQLLESIEEVSSHQKVEALMELMISTLAMNLLEEKLTEMQLEKGFSYIEMAAKKGNHLAKKYLGEIALQIGDGFLGFSLENTRQRNFIKAAKYYLRAYEEKVPAASWLYALCLYEEKDYQSLDDFISSLAPEAIETLQVKLFYLYFLGDFNFIEDLEKAYFWLTKIEKSCPNLYDDLIELFQTKKKLFQNKNET